MRKWFGDSTDEEDDDTMNEDDHSYTKIEREKKNRKKKQLAKEKKLKKVADTARKARNIVGLGPIKSTEINERKTRGMTFEEAKLDAVNCHLRKYYKFNDTEITDISIVETSISNDTVYIAVNDREDIHDLYVRKADCKRDNIFLRTYCPPQFYSRFATLNKICADERQKYPDLKTQVRFGHNDLEILTKDRGSREPFKIVDLQEFIGDNELPSFDHSIKWHKHNDRPPRRRVTSSTHTTPATSPTSSPSNRQNLPAIDTENISRQTRQLSINSQDDSINNKRQKTQDQTSELDHEMSTESNDDQNTTI